jgi:hypothetical protein
MSQRSKRHHSAKPSGGNQEQPFFTGKSHDISKKENEAKKPPVVTPEDNYEKEADAMPKEIQRLATPMEDERKGGTGTNEERMKQDKKSQE